MHLKTYNNAVTSKASLQTSITALTVNTCLPLKHIHFCVTYVMFHFYLKQIENTFEIYVLLLLP